MSVPYPNRLPAWKRVLDILIAGGSLLVLSPVLLAAALAVKVESPGPVLYVSDRIGRGFRRFRLIKFRTMYTDADARVADLAGLNQYAAEDDVLLDTCPNCAELGRPCSPLMVDDTDSTCEHLFHLRQSAGTAGVFVKFMNDPRITRVGRILRKTSVDELPQFLNVLRGDMSIVGNRPLPVYEALCLTADGRIDRFMAPAGLTGLWQVSKRGKGAMSAQERIDLDNEYVRRLSPALDLSIIWRTVPALLQSEDV